MAAPYRSWKCESQMTAKAIFDKKRQAFGKIRQGKAGRGTSFKRIENANLNPPRG
jgi:hypothetical protein